MQVEINETVARRVLEVVDHGLSNGLGKAEPGKMCVEAAVCYALGLPHGDDPKCVAPTLRSLKIRINDSRWSSNAARAMGLRRLAVAQLGSKDALDEREFVKRLADLACRTSVPIALRAAASIHKDPKHKAALLDAANRCENSPNRETARHARAAAAYAASAAASSAAYAAYAAYADAAAASSASSASRDKILSDFAEGVVQILIEMKAPGCQWLVLTELQAA